MLLERAALLALLLASAPLVARAEEVVGPRTRFDVGGDLDVYADNGPVPANRLLEARLFGQIGRPSWLQLSSELMAAVGQGA